MMALLLIAGYVVVALVGAYVGYVAANDRWVRWQEAVDAARARQSDASRPMPANGATGERE
ncbi:hypothetical protein [Microbacterium gorillae]|uniref:hypothetical protein n=1 Tax=Microbacterium gorillae TaxID=1231063 RepID=UPI003D969EDC